MGSVYAIANQKGGVGQDDHRRQHRRLRGGRRQPGAALRPRRRSATRPSPWGSDRDAAPSSYDCLIGECSVAEAARPAGPDNLWIVPANRDLAGAAVELPRIEGSSGTCARCWARSASGSRSRCSTALPSLGPVTVNALVAADRVIVPVQAEYLALEGLVQFLETLELVRRELNPGLVLTGVVITMHDERTRLAQRRRARASRPLRRARVPHRDPAQRPGRGGPELRPAGRSSTRRPRAGSGAYRELAAELAEREAAERVSVERSRSRELTLK